MSSPVGGILEGRSADRSSALSHFLFSFVTKILRRPTNYYIVEKNHPHFENSVILKICTKEATQLPFKVKRLEPVLPALTQTTTPRLSLFLLIIKWF